MGKLRVWVHGRQRLEEIQGIGQRQTLAQRNVRLSMTRMKQVRNPFLGNRRSWAYEEEMIEAR